MDEVKEVKRVPKKKVDLSNILDDGEDHGEVHVDAVEEDNLIDDDDNDSVRSLTFEDDPKMWEAIGVKKRRKGDEYNDLDYEKIYNYQLKQDIPKIVERYGSFKQKESTYLQQRGLDVNYRNITDIRPLGRNANFEDVSRVTREISWRSTKRPFGVIANKRYQEWLGGKPPGPSKEYLKDLAQRKHDNDLWDDVLYFRTEKSLKQLRFEAKLQETERRKLLKIGEFEEKEMISEAAQYALNQTNMRFDLNRQVPTKRQAMLSMDDWDYGIHQTFELDKGFPMVEVIDTKRAGDSTVKVQKTLYVLFAYYVCASVNFILNPRVQLPPHIFISSSSFSR